MAGAFPNATSSDERLPHAAATEEVDDREQDDRAEQGDEQGAEVERSAQEVAAADQRAEQQAAQERADDADDDVQEDALLGVRTHDDAGQPADDTAHDECND